MRTVSGPPWMTSVLAVAILANGVLAMTTLLATRLLRHPVLLRSLLPFGYFGVNRSLTLGLGLLLVYLSFQLAERRRVAWWSASVVVFLATTLRLTRDEWTSAAVAASMGTLLLASRRRFSVRTDPRRAVQGVVLAAAMVTIALVYGAVGFWLLEARDFGRAFSPGEAMMRSLLAISLVGSPDLVPATRHAAWFLDSLRLLGGLAVLMVAWSLFRPLAYHLCTLPQERAEAEAIVARHGRAPLDYFKLWPDKSYFFSPGRSSVIAYRSALSVAVSLGDPVGPDDELPSMIAAFSDFCADNGWRAAFHQVGPDLVAVYRGDGFRVLKIGEEAMVNLQRFAARTIRQRCFAKPRRRLLAAGYRATREHPPHPSPLLDEAEEVSREWLSLPGRRERSFALGQFDRSYLARTTLVVARDHDGRLVAFLNELPDMRPGLATVDLMRHRCGAPNGIMDYLFSELMLRLAAEGYRWFSLGLAPLAGVGEHPGAGLHERAAHQLYEHLNALFSFKGLRSYKAKFEPVWEERFLAYRDGPHALLKTALALRRITQR